MSPATGAEGFALQSRLVRAIEPYARCHLACVEVTPSLGNGILPLLFPKEPVSASPLPPISGGDHLFQYSARMIQDAVFGQRTRQFQRERISGAQLPLGPGCRRFPDKDARYVRGHIRR